MNLNNIKCKISYILNQKVETHTVFIEDKIILNGLTVEVKEKSEGKVTTLNLKLIPENKIIIKELYLESTYNYLSNDKIFLNGYQSWTNSCEFDIDEKTYKVPWILYPVKKTFKLDQYGDYTFYKYKNRKGELHSYTYTYVKNAEGNYSLAGSLTEKKGFTIFHHSTGKKTIYIKKECAELQIDGPYDAFDLVFLSGNETEVFDKYFDLMKIKKPVIKETTGWTSWYNYYEDITEEIILENVNHFKEKNIPIDIFQIDDGFQNAVGDWLITNDKFPNGMKYLAEKIKSFGYKSGLWLAPFSCEKNSIMAKEHPEWILKDEKGKKVFAGSNWSQFYALDFYNKEVQNYLREVFHTVLNEWNFDMVKLDFLYSACLLPRKNKTRGQIMTEAMEFLREVCGDKLILGCGVPLGASFGLVDYCRIGCDIGLDWNGKFYNKYLHREMISTKNSIENAIGRHHLNNRAFLNDPDVFLLRRNNILMTDIQKNTLFKINRTFGSLVFTSDDISKYSENELKNYNESIPLKNIEILETEKNKAIYKIKYKSESKTYLLFLNVSDKDMTVTLDEKDIKKWNIKSRVISIAPYSTLEFT